jgi:hypothetical protein
MAASETSAGSHPSSRVHRSYRRVFPGGVFLTGSIKPQTPMGFLPQLKMSFDPTQMRTFP